MAKATRITIKSSGKKGNSSGTVPCNMCKGTGRLPSGYNKKNK